MSINGATTLAGNTTVTTAGASITFNGTIDGAFALVLNGGAISLPNAVGGVTPLMSVTASGSSISVQNVVTTTGAQSYTGVATLDADLITSGGAVVVNGAATLQGGGVQVNTNDLGASPPEQPSPSPAPSTGRLPAPRTSSCGRVRAAPLPSRVPLAGPRL